MEADDIRRLVVIDEGQSSKVLSDGPSPDVRIDPARPGFSLARMWVTQTTPIDLRGLRETLHLPNVIEPPEAGSVCYVVTFPPDESYDPKKIGADQVEAYFRSIGAPAASTYSRAAPHPYMQKTRTLDLCLVIEGEITLVLDREEVHLKAGDTVVQRGTNHAWSNRSGRSCVVAFSSHDGRV